MGELASLCNWQLFCVQMTERRLLEQLKLLHILTGEKVRSTVTTNSYPIKNFKDKGNHHIVVPCSWEPGLQSWISQQPSLISQELQKEINSFKNQHKTFESCCHSGQLKRQAEYKTRIYNSLTPSATPCVHPSHKRKKGWRTGGPW